MLPGRRTVCLLLLLVAQTCNFFFLHPSKTVLPSTSVCVSTSLSIPLSSSLRRMPTKDVYDLQPREWNDIDKLALCKICRKKWCDRRGLQQHEKACQAALDVDAMDRVRATWANAAPVSIRPSQGTQPPPGITQTSTHGHSNAGIGSSGHGNYMAAATDEWDSIFLAPEPLELSHGNEAELYPFTQEISDSALGHTSPSTPSVPVIEQESLDRILIRWHPSTMRKDDNVAFEDFNPDPDLSDIAWQTTAESADNKTFAPHSPFNTELDFEIADFLNDTGLTKKAGERYFKLLQKVSMNPKDWTMRDWSTYTKTMDAASELVNEFKSETFEAKHVDDTFKFTVYFRDMQSWCMDLLNEPSLKPYLEFDARKMFVSTDGREFRQFWREPNTGELWWNIQDHISKKYGNNNVKPVCLIIYTDKSRLSSFGTVQAYPIVARLANLPDHIRNNNGLGGGRVVGFLPVISEHDRYKNTTAWANFKREVEHRALEIFLRSVVDWHKKGPVPYQFSDEIRYNVLPYVLIYSCDYEEAILLTLTRGVAGSHPCVFCLAPKDQLMKNRDHYAMRDWEKEKEMYKNNASDKSYGLQGLRRVKNAFWELPFFNLHKALSFDTLHAFFSGLGDRISKTLVGRVSARDSREGSGPKKGPNYGTKLDNNIALFPRWPGLNHFSGVTQIINKMSDGTKRDHLARQLMFCLHGIVTRTKDPIGYTLLKAFRKYQEMVLYASLSVQTLETREGGEAASLAYTDLIQEYADQSSAQEGSNVNWNFPKNHIFKHFWQFDISMKGVSKNMSTKINEAMHRPLKFTYQNRTNFKNVEVQIARYERRSDAMAFILHRIDWFKRFAARDTKGSTTSVGATGDGGNTSAEGADKKAEGGVVPDNGGDTSAKGKDKKVEVGVIEDDGQVGLNAIRGDHCIPGCDRITVHGAQPGANPKTKHEVGTRSIIDVETAGDAAHRNLATKLEDFVVAAMSDDKRFQDPQVIRKFKRRGFADTDEIRLYSSLKVSYASEVNWKTQTDIVRSISSFHSTERFDCILYHTVDGNYTFGRLLHIIRCFPFGIDNGPSIVCALVHPYDAALLKSQELATLDQDLCFYRVRSQSRKDSRIIPIASIVRGALLVEDVFKVEGYLHQEDYEAAKDRHDYLVMDIIDEDMFIRMKTLPYRGRRPEI
ncbi:hypothetical protein CYLTODRAFT_382521 [Cylindrobasidium torrendii FP15055 ss-10]|uniref:C2H2-type domain-containing protein n=1 Tax=Cylindrobasidium torrendii FP15055 ss-10 TaxID=1314674 RepID=A0A0D7AYG2_9AGAR|nr:hypothetical protein CYLTODRAFT_382521 [Cylindrobasidium torrendii FP15055 ss-10]